LKKPNKVFTKFHIAKLGENFVITLTARHKNDPVVYSAKTGSGTNCYGAHFLAQHTISALCSVGVSSHCLNAKIITVILQGSQNIVAIPTKHCKRHYAAKQNTF
jgi:hypothetical protein